MNGAIRSGACLLALVLAARTPAAAGAASGGAVPFPRLAQLYVADSERHDPLFADAVGIHAYDDRLDDYSAQGHRRRIAWLRSWRAAVATSLRSGLGVQDQADAHALLDTIDLELFEDATVRPFHNDPTFYTGVIGNAVYALTGRRYAPADERFRHVARRLALIPAVVAAAERNLTRPTRVATLQAIDENAGNVVLYSSLNAQARSTSAGTRRSLSRAVPAALRSVRRFSAYLRATLLPRSNGNPRVGAHVFDRELLLANGTTQSRSSLVADATLDFEHNRSEMLRLALPFDKQFFPDKVADETKSNAEDIVVRRVLDRLAGDHPTPGTIFSTAKADVQESENFLREHPVVVLPEPATLYVVPTPAFMAGFSGASLDPAGPFTPLAESYFYIDGIPAAWNAQRVSSYLRDFNNYEMKLLSIHEAVPGHYVQYRYNDQVSSIVRRAFPSGSFAEGWAVYGEGMMLDAGYDSDDPRLRLFQLKWRLREEANTLIDAAFHTANLTRERCDDLLERQAYQEPAEAETKWHRLQLSHDQLTSYFVGLAAIGRAEAAQRASLGNAFDRGRFNTALLAMGSVEPRYIETLLRTP